MPPPDPAALRELERDLAELARRESRNRLVRYRPHPKQLEFHAAGREHNERLFLAGNQCGKSTGGAAELAMHATGNYPAWWPGRRFDKAIVAWALSVTSELTRDNAQRLLIGPPASKERWGEGMIPGDAIVSHSASRGVADAIDQCVVRHASGGQSIIMFRSYERGRERLQGASLDCIWFDEEPAADIYSEGMARLAATNGIAYCTATPLLGMSAMIGLFLGEPVAGSPADPDELAKPPGWTAADDDPLSYRPPPKPPLRSYDTRYRIHR